VIYDVLVGLFSRDMAIDLGTANTMVYVKGQGIILTEPSIVAVDRDTNEVLAVGKEAKAMLGRTPQNITAVRPLQDGVIADFEVTEKMLRHFLTKVHNRHTMIRPRIIIAIPSGGTEVEKRAVRDSAEQAGAREVFLVEEPMAAAIGAKLPIAEPSGNMIVDIGGGTTEVAVISLAGIVYSKSVRVGGNKLDQTIVNYIKKTYNVLIGEASAEMLKIKIGSAFPLKEELKTTVKGLDLVTGLPRMLELTSEEIRSALEEPLLVIIDTIKQVLEKTPPELVADIVDRGIVMAGGTSLLKGMEERLTDETQVPVNLSEDPLSCVVKGCGTMLDESADYLRKIVVR